MKLETVLAKYTEISAPKASILVSTLSPDGWCNPVYNSVTYPRLESEELVEFINVVMSFFHECKSQNDLKKFCKKHGKEIDALTIGFRFDCALMTYVVHIQGYSAEFTSYRKENA